MNRNAYWRHRRTEAHLEFRRARDLLLEHRTDPDRAAATFRWPATRAFNWALEWFDVVAADNRGPALELLRGGARAPVQVGFPELSVRSDTVACWLRDRGVRAADRVLVVLDARLELWEAVLACLKIGAVVIPCHVGLTRSELADRVRRSRADHLVCLDGVARLTCPAESAEPFPGIRGLRLAVGHEPPPGWLPFPGADHPHRPFVPDGPTSSDAVAFCYFTSGTTSAPKLVAHSHRSYPVGHLSSMYWNGLVPGDRHLNVSSPGWAKHSWSSLFVPWNAEATVVAPSPAPVPAAELPALLAHHAVNSLCAPPSTWKGLLPFLDVARPSLREATSAGEPLDPVVADRVERAWGVRPRDGYGQTETTALIGNTPGRPAPRGRLGQVLPGYRLVLRERQEGAPDVEHPVGPGDDVRRGEICVDLSAEPAGAMLGYLGDLDGSDSPVRRTESFGAGLRQVTGDLAECDQDGWIRLLGRHDDMFKSFDRRISPLELEAVLATHPAVADVAVIPLPDPIGGHVPHAVVVPRPGVSVDGSLEHDLLEHARTRLTDELRPRSVSFTVTLPRTVTGKVNRAALRAAAS